MKGPLDRGDVGEGEPRHKRLQGGRTDKENTCIKENRRKWAGQWERLRWRGQRMWV